MAIKWPKLKRNLSNGKGGIPAQPAMIHSKIIIGDKISSLRNNVANCNLQDPSIRLLSVPNAVSISTSWINSNNVLKELYFFYLKCNSKYVLKYFCIDFKNIIFQIAFMKKDIKCHNTIKVQHFDVASKQFLFYSFLSFEIQIFNPTPCTQTLPHKFQKTLT